MNIIKNHLVFLVALIKERINQNPRNHKDGRGAEQLMENERISVESINDKNMRIQPNMRVQPIYQASIRFTHPFSNNQTRQDNLCSQNPDNSGIIVQITPSANHLLKELERSSDIETL